MLQRAILIYQKSVTLCFIDRTYQM